MAMKSGDSGERFKREHLADINVTPFVDVMLVLLVIFMVTAPMMTTGINVDLPEASSQPLPGNDEPLSINIASNGNILIQGKTEVDLKDLQAKLVAIANNKMDIRIFVYGDKNVDYGRVLKVMGEISTAGFTRVGLVTEQAPAAAEAKPAKTR